MHECRLSSIITIFSVLAYSTSKVVGDGFTFICDSDNQLDQTHRASNTLEICVSHMIILCYCHFKITAVQSFSILLSWDYDIF